MQMPSFQNLIRSFPCEQKAVDNLASDKLESPDAENDELLDSIEPFEFEEGNVTKVIFPLLYTQCNLSFLFCVLVDGAFKIGSLTTSDSVAGYTKTVLVREQMNEELQTMEEVLREDNM